MSGAGGPASRGGHREADRPEGRPAGVSVITATLDRPEVLLRKAAALAAQTLERDRWEWIVAFDGPQPGLERDLRASVPDDLRLRTVTTDRVGPGPARDAAARHAAFPVLLFSDDDCLPARDALARHLEAQADPGVYLGTVAFRDADHVQTAPPPRRPRWWNVNGANTSLPTASYRSVGGFGDAIRGYGGEDVWLGWRLEHAGVAIRALPDARAEHLGPDPMRTAPAERARSAGANAVRLARLEPRMRWRLGVDPLLLVLKLTLLTPIRPLGAGRVAGEWAYSLGAWREWRRAR